MLLCRRSSLTFPRLSYLDAASTVAISTCYGLMGAAFALDHSDDVVDFEPRHAIMVGLLACTYVVLARAAILPSATGRIVWVSAVAMIPIVGLNSYVLATIAAGLNLTTSRLRPSFLDPALRRQRGTDSEGLPAVCEATYRRLEELSAAGEERANQLDGISEMENQTRLEHSERRKYVSRRVWTLLQQLETGHPALQVQPLEHRDSALTRAVGTVENHLRVLHEECSKNARLPAGATLA